MKILVAVDFSPAAAAVLRQARHYAKALAAEVWLVHVAPPDPEFVGYEAGPQTVRDQVAEKFHAEHRALQQQAEEFRHLGLNVASLLLQGPTSPTILAEADRLQVDLIILGSHGHGALYQVLVGSVSEGVLRKAGRPVLVVPTRGGG
jgi:nucleotide-binding universal stress UspA family protein